MKTKFIEAKNNFNWGKFAICRFDPEEWARPSSVDAARTVLRSQGWDPRHVWVLDLATGEGAFFMPGGHAGSDLNKHAVWVCPLFEPFLAWLYEQDLSDLDALPAVVDIAAPASMHGHRRPGPARKK